MPFFRRAHLSGMSIDRIWKHSISCLGNHLASLSFITFHSPPLKPSPSLLFSAHHLHSSQAAPSPRLHLSRCHRCTSVPTCLLGEWSRNTSVLFLFLISWNYSKSVFILKHWKVICGIFLLYWGDIDITVGEKIKQN